MWAKIHLTIHNTAVGIGSGLIALFLPIWKPFALAAIMILADFFSGLWKSRAKGELWTSARFRNSCKKTSSYMSVMLLGYAMDCLVFKELGIEGVYAMKIVSGFIAGVEFYSVLENLHSATGLRVFYLLTQFTNKKLKDMTGMEEDIGCDK